MCPMAFGHPKNLSVPENGTMMTSYYYLNIILITNNYD